MKRSPLTRKTPLKRTSLSPARKPLKGRPNGTKRRRYTSAVRARSQGRCEAATDVCAGTAAQVHHLLQRSVGGTDDLDNLLDVCGPCHGWIHDNEAVAVGLGLLRWRYPHLRRSDPADGGL